MLGFPIEQIAPLAGWIVGAGILVGILAGLFGIGGGAIIVPVLYEMFHILAVPDAVRMQLCVGTSLAIILPTTITGSLPRPSWYTENLGTRHFLEAMVTRRFNATEAVVVTVTQIDAGSAHNVIPDRALLKGTIRTLTPGRRTDVWSAIRQLAENIDQVFWIGDVLKAVAMALVATAVHRAFPDLLDRRAPVEVRESSLTA